MLPTLTAGPWQVDTHGLMLALAVMVAGAMSCRRLRRIDRPPGVILTGVTLAILGGLAFDLLAYLVPRWWRWTLGEQLAGGGGLRVTWALVGAVLTAAAYCRSQRVSLGRALDLGALPMPLGQAIGRLGCLAAGCCGGKLTASWLGMLLPDSHGVWAARYPTQLLCSAADVLIWITLLVVENAASRQGHCGTGVPRRELPDGFLFLLYVALFSLKRFGIGFLRADVPPLLGPLGWMHLHALAGLAVAGVLMIAGWVSTVRRPAAAACFAREGGEKRVSMV